MAQRTFSPKRAGPGRSFNGNKHLDDLYRGNQDWAQYRDRFLRQNKFCYACGKIACVVDHITPHKGDKILFEKLDNHLPLCFTCHNIVTAKFDRTFVVGAPILPKISWIVGMRNRHGLTTRVSVLPYYGKDRD